MFSHELRQLLEDGYTLVIGEVNLGLPRALQVAAITTDSHGRYAGVVGASCEDWTADPAGILHLGSKRYGLPPEPFELGGSDAIQILHDLPNRSPDMRNWAPGKTSGWTLIGGSATPATRRSDTTLGLVHTTAFSVALTMAVRHAPEWESLPAPWPQILERMIIGTGALFASSLQLRAQHGPL